MPSTTGPTEKLRSFIDSRRDGGLSRQDVAEAQRLRAHLTATAGTPEPLLKEYAALIVNPTRDQLLADADGFEDRVKAATAIYARSPTTRISPEHLLPDETPGPYRFRVDESLADGLFNVDDARAALAKKPNKTELVELFMSVAGKTSYVAKELMLEEIVGDPKPAPTRPPSPPARPKVTVDLAPTIARLEAHVDGLEARVDQLERQNAESLRQIQSLVSQIEQRKEIIRDNYEDKRRAAMIFAMFGAPSAAMVSLMAMERDDSRLSELNRQLDAHRAEQARLQASVADYEAMARPARKVLATLETAARELSTAARTSDRRLAPAAAAAARLGAGTKLVSNLRSQLSVLEGLRGRASAINQEMSSLIRALEGDLRVAEKMVEESRAEAHEVLQLLLDPDPEAAARALLEARGRAVMEKAQRELGLKVDAFVTDLLKKAFPRGGAAAELLKQQILAQY